MTTGAPVRMPKVSIIIPVYNGERYLAETLQSVAAQTEEDWEVIAVNDGSNDGSLAILEEAVRNDPGRVRVITISNGGVSRARNHGVREARGEYIAFLDQDDLWLPEKLHLQLDQFRSDRSLGISYTNESIINSQGILVKERALSLDGRKNRGWVFRYLIFNNFIPVSSIMIKKDVFDTIGGFDTRYALAEDYDFLLKAVRIVPVDFIDKPLVLYREHGESGTHLKIDHITSESFSVLHSWCARDPWFFRIHFLEYLHFWLKFKVLKIKVLLKKR